MAQTVLVVDDEPRIAAIAADYLRHAGYAVLTAADGLQALELARTKRPDLVVLDLGLPELGGLEVARALRAETAVPIVMLTARVEESDRLLGLELGADDYITKPFSPRELVARVKAVLRRTDHGGGTGTLLRLADLTLDTARLSVSRGGGAIDLTPTEFQLLATLARHPGRVFTRAQLLDAVRGEAGESFDRAIDAHVKNVRRKLEPDTRNPRYILTVYGVGYKAAES
ncbi:MAG: DNA-binding response regulator [Acidobacteria bacterium]|nr:MAG: DNA-binding response regulator [Acidobacteriota bacterium]